MVKQTHSHGLQLQSTMTETGKLELRLVDVETPEPKDDEVVIRMEAAPINPSDIRVLFGTADLSTAQIMETADGPVMTADIPKAAMGLTIFADRIGRAWPTGNEGAGVVVATGASDAAKALLGKTVAMIGAPSYAQYRCIPALQCLVMPEGVTSAEAASSFVNPLTALGMVETMRMEGHKALVHTVGASNLGQMLIKLCQTENVELVNIVRKPEQEELLKSLGAKYVCNSTAPDFAEQLTEALAATGATLAFDAIGGGKLASQILNCMETAISRTVKSFGAYGTPVHKQVYVYGGLDISPMVVDRFCGMAWGIGGWLMSYFLEKVGLEKVFQLQQKIAAEIKTTFASHYTREIGLREALQPEVIAQYARAATGEKFLLTPNT